MKLKAEKREEKRRKRRSHKVSGAGVKKLAKLIEEKSRNTQHVTRNTRIL